MASQQSFVVCDSSTYANFYSWSSLVSGFLAAQGWLQGTDTGQIMFTGLSVTAVAMTGTTMACTYTSLTGLALAVGRSLTVTGWTGGNTGNNGTFRITALGSGSFSAVDRKSTRLNSS